MRVEWHMPVTLHIHPDVIDPKASQLRRSADGVVQLLVGAEVSVKVWLRHTGTSVSAHVGEVVSGVTSMELDDTAGIDDDTVLHADGIVAAGDAVIQPLMRTGNDVDDTIIGQPALAGAEIRQADIDDQTILGQPAAMADVIDDPDASADTVIGPGRSRSESPTGGAAPASAPVVTGTPLLPPALPAIPSISASAHVNAGVSPTGSRRTRIEPAGASGGATSILAVSFPDGRTVALDRAVYVGRSPKSPRITSGLVPELVAVPSPRREVSSTHVEIQQEGRAVVVRDLGSTNGTRVRAPGAAPSLLSPGASRVVAVGTLLDLGDDVVLEIVERSGASW
ncbi:FHA domain-containing protein [Agreia bicolorata]|uniref:FHA domain-containing protein n=2 Tax=Agreia bicolorata TaxID=110935 RepID=A0A1T4XPH8_9MICO|nr:FHA domain-containing protein [Agreia bicolorata]